MKVFINPDFFSSFDPQEDIQHWKINFPESEFPPEPERVTVTREGYGYSLVFDKNNYYLEITNVDKNNQTYQVLKTVPLDFQENSLGLTVRAGIN